jgi:hypothetical protein
MRSLATTSSLAFPPPRLCPHADERTVAHALQHLPTQHIVELGEEPGCAVSGRHRGSPQREMAAETLEHFRLKGIVERGAGGGWRRCRGRETMQAVVGGGAGDGKRCRQWLEAVQGTGNNAGGGWRRCRGRETMQAVVGDGGTVCGDGRPAAPPMRITRRPALGLGHEISTTRMQNKSNSSPGAPCQQWRAGAAGG